MTLNSATVAAWDPALAADWNNLRKDLLQKAGDYATTTGSANAFLLTIDAQITAYTDGLIVACKTNFAPTGATTINVNGIGVANVKTNRGNAVYDGYIPNGMPLILRHNGTDFIVQNYQDLSLVGRLSLTAGEDIVAMDSVYVSAGSTVKSLIPTGLDTPTGVTTSPSHVQNVKTLQLSNGIYLHISWWSRNNSGALYAQVRTINAGETDFTNGTEQTIDSGTTYEFDCALIDTNKVMITWNLSGTGLRVVVITISGTTITMGTAITVDTTATSGTGTIITVAKLATDKALITYQRDSDQNIMCKVLSVSGTTISSGTAVSVYVQWNIIRWLSSSQLGTDSVIIIYAANSNLLWNTISVSGTTPTVGAQQTIIATSADYTISVKSVSSTKALLLYCNNNTPVNDQACILTISGATITKWSDLALWSNRNYQYYFWSYIISSKLAIVSKKTSATEVTTYLLSISWATPTSLASNAQTTSSSTYLSSTVVKVKPWLYMSLGGENSNCDYIYKLTNGNGNFRIGIAESSIANAATWNITQRFQVAILSSLTSASVYYVDDNSQPTVNSWWNAPTIGVSISTTQLLLTS